GEGCSAHQRGPEPEVRLPRQPPQDPVCQRKVLHHSSTAEISRHLPVLWGRNASPPPPSQPPPRPLPSTGRPCGLQMGQRDVCLPKISLPSWYPARPGSPKTRPLSEALSLGDLEAKVGGEGKGPGAEDKPSPFGIKLRRTNFSLRFHSEQPTEKRKKRYSAGDSFEGIPTPLTPTHPDLEGSVFPSPTSPLREDGGKPPLPAGGASDLAALSCRPPVFQKPCVAPKPPSATPPPSPLSRGNRSAEGAGWERGEHCRAELASQQSSRQEEVELKEKRSFFPSINIPWREKGDRRAELRREKPSLQSRHSLDSARTQEKEAGPLWITLALQKQKGFRDQQLSREERRHMREVKLAEKQAKDRETSTLTIPPETQSSSTVPKPHPPPEERPDMLLSKFERRENLRKSNTLPTSVTVEIADSTTSPPAVKDVTKRFPSSDSPAVSTEPAWLALAKRKAKAWSDCPQIIK
ncbi:hypothetical protein ANANG_G00074330, partial [Anguilla anguilla]